METTQDLCGQIEMTKNWLAADRSKVRQMRKGDKFMCIRGHQWTVGDWYKDGDNARYAMRDDGHQDIFAASAEVIPCR